MVGAAAALLSVPLLLPPLLAHQLLHPRRLLPSATPASLGLRYEEVSFAGQDVELHGWYLPGTGSAGVVIVHGFPGERSSLGGIAPALHAAGFHVLLYDQRAAGSSGGHAVTFGYYEAGDLNAAADFLRAHAGVRPVGALGVSLGAAVAVLAAGQGRHLDAVVADSAFTSLHAAVAEGVPARLFGAATGWLAGALSPLILRHAEWQTGLRAADVRPLGVVSQISPRPVMFIHGLDDNLYSHQHSVLLYEAASDPKELWLVPETAHAHARITRRAEYDGRVVGFFERALLARGRDSRPAT
jgi:fermentation-respiration switch protein FrsA (DUF1100 family)